MGGMERTVKVGSPIVFIVASVWLFVESGFFHIPANDALIESLTATIERQEESIALGTLPSLQSLDRLRKKRTALLGLRKEFGAVAEKASSDDNLAAILKEWGYEPDDPPTIAIKELEKQILQQIGPSKRKEKTEAVKIFLCDMARKSGDADLFTILSLTALRERQTRREAPMGTLLAFTLEFSFVSGVSETVRFIERWILDAPAGVFIKPENMTFQRVDPNLWGTSLKYYSGPPVRVDLDISVLINIDNP